ncbi:MAG: hypothetical protein AMXMBFR59_28030 [Rhodanobacteraceae bacterium]
MAQRSCHAGIAAFSCKKLGPHRAAGQRAARVRPAAFFAPRGWREAELRSTWDEAWRLDRKPAFAGLWRALPWLAPCRRDVADRMAAIVLLEAADDRPAAR